MARAFQRKGAGYAARLDAGERAVVTGLMEQVLAIVAPEPPVRAVAGDDFDQIVAGLGGLGSGVPGPGEQSPAAPDDAAALTGRDPALERLLPSAHREDAQAAADFRRMTEGCLRTRKADNLRVAIGALSQARNGRVELTPPQALATVVALTDVRLVLGERLGVRTDEDMETLEEKAAGLPNDDPVLDALAIYDFVTWLQETLASAMLPTAGREA